jgi:hypothetical protein
VFETVVKAACTATLRLLHGSIFLVKRFLRCEAVVADLVSVYMRLLLVSVTIQHYFIVPRPHTMVAIL